MSNPRRAAALVLAFAGALWVHTAAAQDAATAEALYEEGQVALAAGRVAEACNKFDASHRLVPTTVNLGALASCHERMGRTASAAGELNRLAGEYRQRGKLDKEREARARAEALEPKIPKLTVRLSPDARLVPGLEVSRDDVRLDSALLETALPVDPGSHTVTAKAAGFTTWVTVVEVGTGNESKELTVPGLVRPGARPPPKDGTAPPPATSGAVVGVAPLPPPEEDKKGSLTSRQRLGLGVGVPGVVVLAVGVALGARTYGKQSDARDLCPRVQCSDPRAIELNDAARSTYPFALAATVVGAAAGAVGTYFYFTPDPQKKAPRAAFAPSLAPSFAGLGASGSFLSPMPRSRSHLRISSAFGASLALTSAVGCIPEALVFVPAESAAGAGGSSAGAAGSPTGGSSQGGGTAGSAGRSGAGQGGGGASGTSAGSAGKAGSAGGGNAGTSGNAGTGGAGTSGAGGVSQAGNGGQAGKAGASGSNDPGGAGGQAGKAGSAGSGGGAAGTSGNAGAGGGTSCTEPKLCQGDDLYTCNNGVLTLATPCPTFGCTPVLATCSSKCRVGTLTCTGGKDFSRCLDTGNGFETGTCGPNEVCNDALDKCTACATNEDCGSDEALAKLGLDGPCVSQKPVCLPTGVCSTVGPTHVVVFGTDVTPPGDCHLQICDGDGRGKLVVADTDEPEGDHCGAGKWCLGGEVQSAAKNRGAVCNGGNGRCNDAGACTGAPSCAGMSAGPTARGSEMCAIAKVNGGQFDLNKTTTQDPPAVIGPHAVGNFWMDRYEVTVGRFRRFIAAYDAWRLAGNPPAMGGYDSKLKPYPGDNACIGWNQHDYLPKCATSLEARVSAQTLTWTAAPEVTAQGFPLDERPMVGGLPWALARAFCSWDGGRLPTYAEHFYVKAHGSQGRDAPWLTPPEAMASVQPTDACWAGALGTNPSLLGNGSTYYALPCLVGGYCSDGGSNDSMVNRNSAAFGAAQFRDVSLGVSTTPIYDLAGSTAEWMLDASVPYATDGVTRCVDCVRSRAWAVSGGRATLGYHWREAPGPALAASVKRQGDGLCAAGTQTMGFRCVYTDRGDEVSIAPPACVVEASSADPLGAADCDRSAPEGPGFSDLCP